MESTLPSCPACAGLSVKRNGHQSGKQRYCCRDCRKTWRDNPASRATDPQRKATILAAYHERMSQRGLARVFA
jgi:transposase-like protein